MCGRKRGLVLVFCGRPPGLTLASILLSARCCPCQITLAFKCALSSVSKIPPRQSFWTAKLQSCSAAPSRLSLAPLLCLRSDLEAPARRAALYIPSPATFCFLSLLFSPHAYLSYTTHTRPNETTPSKPIPTNTTST